MPYSRILFFILLSCAEISFSAKSGFHIHPDNITGNAGTLYLNEDAIIGKWMTTDHSLEVEVYKSGDKFHAKIIWFKIEDTTRPMNTRTDTKNPNPALRNRKWLGMEVLRNLKYNVNENEWQGGIIYDAKHGREWDSIAWINSRGLLNVKGYWIFRWLSQTLTFKRVL